MHINQLKYLIAVVKYSSMSAASDKLFVSQPTISSAISNLEKEFNIHIFNRNSEGVTLTEEGRLFVSKAKYILDEIDSLNNFYNIKNKNNLNLSISCDINYDLSNVISKIYKYSNYTNINLSLREEPSSKVFADVVSGTSELGFFMTNSIDLDKWIGLFIQNNISYKKLNSNNGYVLVGRNSPLYNKDFVTTTDLNDLTIIHYVDNPSVILENQYPKNMISLYGNTKIIYLSEKSTMEKIICETDLFVVSGNKNFENLPYIKSIALKIPDFYFSFYVIKKNNIELSDSAELFLELFNDTLM